MCVCYVHNNQFTDGVDYIAVNRTVTFPPNELRVSVTVDIINDRIHEDNETFIAVLKASNSFNDVVIGEQSTSVGIIFDDDILGNYVLTYNSYK